EGGSGRCTASDHAGSPRIQSANRLVEAVAAVHQRMPIVRIRQPRNYLADEAKHSQSLDDIKADDRENSDHCSDQRRAHKSLASGYGNNQAQPQQRKKNLDENSSREVN